VYKRLVGSSSQVCDIAYGKNVNFSHSARLATPCGSWPISSVYVYAVPQIPVAVLADTLTWTVTKEVNRPPHSGIATSVVNVGIS
jgi:hypothetical protein